MKEKVKSFLKISLFSSFLGLFAYLFTKFKNYFGWPVIIGFILGVIVYFSPKWLAEDIIEVESVLHIPIIDMAPELNHGNVFGNNKL